MFKKILSANEWETGNWGHLAEFLWRPKRNYKAWAKLVNRNRLRNLLPILTLQWRNESLVRTGVQNRVERSGFLYKGRVSFLLKTPTNFFNTTYHQLHVVSLHPNPESVSSLVVRSSSFTSSQCFPNTMYANLVFDSLTPASHLSFGNSDRIFSNYQLNGLCDYDPIS